jgi:hypothetical protein
MFITLPYKPAAFHAKNLDIPQRITPFACFPQVSDGKAAASGGTRRFSAW